MTSGQFRRVRDLFEEALDVEAAQVRAWLAARTDDAEVIAEVLSLRDHDEKAGVFLSAPVADRVAHLFDDDAGLAPDAVVGSYRIVRELGRGGMGRVYLAVDERLGRQVALKALPPARTAHPGERERLRREARAAASLSHPGICTVYALEEIDGALFIAAEYLEGESLRDEISRGPRPSAAAVARDARELAAALESAHARGITHRDLKPENVMRGRDGHLRILDFGLALMENPIGDGSVSPRVTQPGAFVGTPAYMAPEQLNGRDADARSDVFALGVLVYEFASGRHPFGEGSPLAMTARILESAAPALETLRPDLPVSLVSVVERSLRKDPAERFRSAAEVVAALGATDGHGPARTVAGWWRNHQFAALGLYAIATGVAWQAKEWLHGWSDTLFLCVGIAATTAGVFRGHLLFTERMNRPSFAAERRRAAPVTWMTDLLIGVALAVNGLLLSSTRSVASLLTIAFGVALVLVRVVVEPATTAAAFGGEAAPDARRQG